MVTQPLWIAYGVSLTLGPVASYVVFHETEFPFVRLKADWTFDITPNRKQFTSGSWYSLMSGFCTGFRFETTTHEVAQAGLKLMLLLPWEELRSQVPTTMSGCGFLFSSFRLCLWVRPHLSGTLSHLSIHLFFNQSHIYVHIDFWLFILFLRLEPNTIFLMAHVKQLHSLRDLFFSTRVCTCQESVTQFFASLFGQGPIDRFLSFNFILYYVFPHTFSFGYSKLLQACLTFSLLWP